MHLLIFSFLIISSHLLAHQPRIVDETSVIVTDPEISKAYYHELSGGPAVYKIDSENPFELYVNVLVPDLPDQKRGVVAVISKNGSPLAKLDGSNFEWKKFFEPFGYDTYWMGPEYRHKVEPGSYEVKVFCPDDDCKYVLAIGELEDFNFSEIANALTVIPQIKKNFFNESPINFIFSPFGWGLILTMFALSFLFGFVFRWFLKFFKKSGIRRGKKNIGIKGRLLRFACGIFIFFYAIMTTWSPILLFVSGFCLFESMFSWCGLNAMLGKDSCSL